MSFEFFEKTLSEEWEFEEAFYLDEWLNDNPKLRRRFTWIGDKDDPERVRGTHAMNQKTQEGLSGVEKTFRIQLPDEIHDFYRRWDGGFLFLGLPLEILSAKEVIRQNKRVRRLQQQLPDDAPCGIIRFVHIADGHYMGYWLANDGKWYWSFFSNEYSDAEQLEDNSPPEPGDCSMPTNFTGWLEFVLKSDGDLPNVWEKVMPRVR